MWNDLGRGILEEFADSQSFADRREETAGWILDDECGGPVARIRAWANRVGPEHIAAKRQEWERRNRDKNIARCARRRAALTPEQKLEISRKNRERRTAARELRKAAT
jgi:hypothetical protein